MCLISSSLRAAEFAHNRLSPRLFRAASHAIEVLESMELNCTILLKLVRESIIRQHYCAAPVCLRNSIMSARFSFMQQSESYRQHRSIFLSGVTSDRLWYKLVA
jgi:hypothetical protein